MSNTFWEECRKDSAQTFVTRDLFYQKESRIHVCSLGSVEVDGDGTRHDF